MKEALVLTSAVNFVHSLRMRTYSSRPSFAGMAGFHSTNEEKVDTCSRTRVGTSSDAVSENSGASASSSSLASSCPPFDLRVDRPLEFGLS